MSQCRTWVLEFPRGQLPDSALAEAASPDDWSFVSGEALGRIPNGFPQSLGRTDLGSHHQSHPNADVSLDHRGNINVQACGFVSFVDVSNRTCTSCLAVIMWPVLRPHFPNSRDSPICHCLICGAVALPIRCFSNAVGETNRIPLVRYCFKIRASHIQHQS